MHKGRFRSGKNGKDPWEGTTNLFGINKYAFIWGKYFKFMIILVYSYLDYFLLLLLFHHVTDQQEIKVKVIKD